MTQKKGKSPDKILKKASLQKKPTTQQTLRQSEDSYQDLFNTIQQAIYIQNPDGTFAEVNTAACAMFRYSREEFIGKTPEFLSAPGMNDLTAIIGKMQKAFSGEPQELEFWGKRKDGTVFPEEIKLCKGTYFGKEVLIATGTDISEKKRAGEVQKHKTDLLQKTQKALLEITRLPSGKFTDYLYTITEIEAKTLDIGRVSIWLRSEDGSEFVCADAYESISGSHDSGDRLKRSDYPRYFRTLDENRILAATDARADERTAEFTASYLIPKGITAMLDIPIRRSGVLIGILCHEHRGTLRVWDIIEQDFAAAVSDQIVSIIEAIERRKVENALRESESRYSALFSNNYSVSLLIDPDTGRIVDANDAAVHYYGYSRDELQSMGIYDLNRLQKKTVINNLIRAKAEKEKHFFSTHYRANGEKRNVEVYSGPIPVRGKPLFYSIIHDITERKRAEQALSESETRLLMAQEIGHIGAWEYNLQTNIIWGSAEGARIYGLPPVSGDFPLERIEACIPEWERVHQALVDLIHEDREYNLEFAINPADGTPQKVIISVARLEKDGAGHPVRVLGIIQDITDRKRAEEALRELGTYNRSLIEASIDPLVTISHDGKIQDVNTATERVTGRPRDELIGTDFSEYFTEPAMARAGYRRVFSEGKILDFPLKIRHRDGHIVPVLYNASVYYDTRGEIKGVFAAARNITEQIKAEEALRESESRYSSLFTNNYSVSLLIDPDTGRIVAANDAAVKYYGYTRDRLQSMGIYDLNRLQKKTVIKNLIRAKAEKEKHFFSTHYRANGEKRFVEIYSGPITVHGKPQFYSIIHDITERKQAEEALRQNEKTLNVILESSPIPKFVIDRNHRVISWNKALEETSGIRARDMIGTKQQWNAFYDHDRPCLSDLLVDGAHERIPLFYAGKYQKSEITEGAYEVTDFFPHLGKSGKWLHFIASPIIDTNGDIIGAVETLEDITALIKVQMSLRDSEERYRTLVDQIPDYVLVHRDGTLRYVNPAAALHLGYNVETLIGKPILEFIAPDYHDIVRQTVLRRMAGEEISPYEMKIIANDGSYRTVLVNGSVISYEGKTASLNVLTDITILKEAEEKIRNANEELEKRVTERTDALMLANEQLTAEVAARTRAELETTRSLEEKVILLREIHHRVKNNLQIIASLLNLQSRYIVDKNVLEAIKDSQSRVRAMALVHERIYRSSSIAEINLREYLDYLTKQILQFYNIRPNQIKTKVIMEDIMADIDTVIPTGLILNELVSNSLKHAFPDGKKGTISIECAREGTDLLRFVYHDDGAGLPRGFDWKNTESLGLRLVNNLVDQLSGTIELGEGEGTTFIITLKPKREKSPV
ncbi:MAG: PAS domain S-box protein [Methanoregula sp.]